MRRHAHMVALLRPIYTYEEQLQNFHYKRELTEEDFNVIIEKAEMVKKAAEEARKQRYGR